MDAAKTEWHGISELSLRRNLCYERRYKRVRMLHTELNTANQQHRRLFFLPHIKPSAASVVAFFVRVLPITVLWIVFTAWCAIAADLHMTNENEESVTWNLTADKLTSLNTSKVLEGEGNVVLRQGNDYLKADFMRYYAATNWVFLRGNVQAKMGSDVLEAEEAEFDLGNRIGWLKNGRVFVEGPHMYLAGERVDKHWGDTYSFHNAKITVCDGDVPAWSLFAKEAKLELDGYAELWHTSFAVKDTNVAYMPLMVVPVKVKRQTGLLFPEFGRSRKMGTWYSQPFYWAIDDSRDMTLTEQWFEKRGLMHGVEYRSQTDSASKSWWRADYLWDKKIDRTEADEDSSLRRDGLVRTNHERYWLRGMYDGVLGDPRWKLRATVDYVSDQNYLREFKQGTGGFSRTRDTLEDLFGRDLQEIDENRENEVQLTRDWDRVGLALSSRYEQNPDIGHGNLTSSEDTTLQRLPQMDMYLYKGALPVGAVEASSLPVDIEATLQAVNFYRNKGTYGSRFDMHPSLSVPLVSDYGTVITTAGWRYTQYMTEREEPLRGSSGDDRGTSRSLPDFSISAFTEVARNFDLNADGSFAASDDNVGEQQLLALRHSVQPTLSYAVVSNEEQDDNPYYDREDRVDPENELRFSLVNVLARKTGKVTKVEGEDGPEPVMRERYGEWIRFRLEQGYNLREADRTEALDEYRRRPLTDIEAELTYTPLEYLRLRTRSFLSPYSGDITRHEHSVSLFDSRIGSITTGLDFRDSYDEYLRQRKNRLRMTRTSATLAYFQPFLFEGLYRADMETGEDLEKGLQITYNHQCFQLIFEYSKTTDDEGVRFLVKIPGLSF